MKYKIKDDYTLRQVAGTWVAVPTGRRATELGSIVTLNDTAVFLWNQLKTGIELQTLLAEVATEYDIDEVTGQKEIEEFLDVLKSKNLLEEMPQ